MAKQPLPSELTPLREPTFLILTALAGQPKHGYAILKDVEMLSEGRIRLSTGTLYGALARLLDQRAVAISLDERDEGNELGGQAEVNRRSRKFYELTRYGRQVLSAEIRRMEGLLAAARREMGIERG